MEDRMVKFKKFSGGTYYAEDGKAYVKGDTIEVEDDKCMRSVMDQWERITPIVQEKGRRRKQFTTEHKGGGKWNVRNGDGELVNDRLLSKAEALAMVGEADEDRGQDEE